MRNKILFAVAVMIMILVGCSKGEKGPGDLSATPVPTGTVATPVPTKAPDPTAVPTPIPTVRDTFTKTDVSGEYEYVLEDLCASSVDAEVVGDRIILLLSDESWMYSLVSLDPATGATETLDLDSDSIALAYINDDVFGITDYLANMVYIYDKGLNVVAEYYKGDVYWDIDYASDGQSIYELTDEGILFEVNIVEGDVREIVASSDFEDAYVSRITSTGLIVISDYDYYLGQTLNWYVDPENGAVMTFDDLPQFTDFYDGERTVICKNGPVYAIDVYECAPEEYMAGIVTESALSLPIENSTETVFPMFDPDNGCTLTYASYYSDDSTIFECRCMSVKDGSEIAKFSYSFKTGSMLWPQTVLDRQNTLMYLITGIDDDIHILAWDYLNDEDNNHRGIFPKFGVVPDYIEQKRAAFEEEHDMYLYLGSEVFTSPFDYRLTICENWDMVSNSIDIIDKVLDLYPEGFFDQLKYDGIKTLGIYLCGGFTKTNDYSIDDAIALATCFDYERALALDLNYSYELERTLVHEISHWIDKRIIAAETFSDRDSFDDAWCALNPSDFSYMYSYVSGKYKWKYVYDENNLDDSYFVDGYSQTYPTEDRARVFEHLMFPNEPYPEDDEYGYDEEYDYEYGDLYEEGLGGDGKGPDEDDGDESEDDDCWNNYYGTEYMKSQHLRNKAAMYFAAIREVFDDSTWPEETSWEMKLRELDITYTDFVDKSF